jgi:two-component system, LytTR family, response regulator
MISCLALDDEKLALDLLCDNISRVPFLDLKAACRKPAEAAKILQEQKIDLIFLDIQMPGQSGLEFLQTLTDKPMVVLVTAYNQYALEGYNLDVLDYLVKPVAFDRFLKACNKAQQQQELQQVAVETTIAGSHPDFFFVNADYSLVKINYADVLMIEGLKDYIKIHLTSSNRPIVTRMSMKDIEDKLPGSHFTRVHKSYIIAIKHISSIRKNTVFLGQLEIPISDTYKALLFEAVGIQKH